MDWRLFFPEQSNQTAHAIGACALCPVRDDCYADAENHTASGIWGGVAWKEGVPRVHDGGAVTSYPPETRSEAIALYRRLRHRYRTEKATLDAIATQLGIRDPDAIRKWVAAEVAHAERQPSAGMPRTAVERAGALAMLARIRPYFPTETAAQRAVARAYGVHPETVRGWQRRADAAAARQMRVAA